MWWLYFLPEFSKWALTITVYLSGSDVSKTRKLFRQWLALSEIRVNPSTNSVSSCVIANTTASNPAASLCVEYLTSCCYRHLGWLLQHSGTFQATQNFAHKRILIIKRVHSCIETQCVIHILYRAVEWCLMLVWDVFPWGLVCVVQTVRHWCLQGLLHSVKVEVNPYNVSKFY